MENTSTVTGEKRYSSRDYSPEKPTFELIPTGDYELKLIGGKVEVAAPSQSNPDSVPYIKTRFEVLVNDGSEKKRYIFPTFFLKTQPSGAKNFVAINSRNGVMALAKAMGEDLDVTALEYTASSGNSHEILNPHEVAAWLKSKDGMVVRAHVKAVKGGKYTDKNGVEQEGKDTNQISYFIMS